jgi:hypothetical protein
VERAQRHQLVAVHHGARAVHGQHPVAVPVEREAELEAARGHALREPGHVRGAAVAVDVASVRIDRHDLQIGSEAPEDLGGHLVGRAVGAVEQDPATRQVEPAEARLELPHVVGLGAVQVPDTADRVARPVLVDEPLDLVLLSVRELGAVGAEELDAVVLVRVVGGRHHGRHVEPVAAHQQGRPGSGQDAAEQRVAAGGRHACRERGLEHLAGLARVADDQHLRRVRGGDRRGCGPERRGQLGGQELAGDAPDAVRAEQPHDAVSASRTAGACGPS